MSQDIHAGPATGTAAIGYRYRWIAFAAILAASVMDLIDVMITNVAAPTIRSELGGSAELMQWLGAAYTMSMAVGLLTGGRLGDIYGRKAMFLIGAAGFTAASVLCGLASSPGMLIASRVVQGLFGAVMLPQGLGFIKQMFPPKETSAAFGAFGPIMGLSAVGGPILGGWLSDGGLLGLGWRAIFLINLPIGIVVLVVGAWFLPTMVRTASRLDWAGIMLASLAVGLLVYPVVQGRAADWPVWTFVSMACSVVMFLAFALYETAFQRRGGEPLIIPALFAKRAFAGGLVMGLAFFCAITGFALVLTVYLQDGLGYSPMAAGLAALPQAVGGVVGFVAAGAGLSDRLGRRLIHIGTAAIAAGITAIQVELAVLDRATALAFAPMLFVMGVGLGFTLAPFFSIVLAGVETHETGSASGALTALQQFGVAVGVAVMGTVYFQALLGRAQGDFVHALQDTLWVVLALQGIAFALAFLLPRRPAANVDYGVMA
ncbi:MFS transporter [Nocardia gipuzkoensis]|uniref:MFS transporter n=1 Tax=Nocardia gipuzkoensis TaxID=2749991 RepID=UPI00237E41C3|nr:MFS transporter [Nocardia gipuzkoensis]MDE1675372.1 MFS transporter [Nocardia gipuzkoensis]